MNVFERAREAWRVFRGRDHPRRSTDWQTAGWYTGPVSSDRPDRVRMKPGNERTLVNMAYNRIALDCATVEMHHAKINENDQFQEIIHDDLEYALTVSANFDQTPQAYMQDVIISMFDEGAVAEVPVMMDQNPDTLEIRDVQELRTGKILEWRPAHVLVEVYNCYTGQKEQIMLAKKEVAIHENPFYSIMNDRNSIFQRLVRKLAILDTVDENSGSDKLNMILQLPYIIRTDQKRREAEQRLHEIEKQLQDNKYGIAYTDGTEKILQLNRPIENNLQKQVEWLTDLFFSQLGITQEILNGTADEKTMTNYMNRIIAPILSSIAMERKRKFLSRERIEKGESIIFHQDPFKLIPVTEIANISDTLTRNAILSPNEVRAAIGYKPVDNEEANQLVNRNMPSSEQGKPVDVNGSGTPEEEAEAPPGTDGIMHGLYGPVSKKTRKEVPRIYLRE